MPSFRPPVTLEEFLRKAGMICPSCANEEGIVRGMVESTQTDVYETRVCTACRHVFEVKYTITSCEDFPD